MLGDRIEHLAERGRIDLGQDPALRSSESPGATSSTAVVIAARNRSSTSSTTARNSASLPPKLL
jgi:hypothetical protein